jgi:hypothetical protein
MPLQRGSDRRLLDRIAIERTFLILRPRRVIRLFPDLFIQYLLAPTP